MFTGGKGVNSDRVPKSLKSISQTTCLLETLMIMMETSDSLKEILRRRNSREEAKGIINCAIARAIDEATSHQGPSGSASSR
ncbi:hypothetical protein L3Y34_007107 [Caenorhabditis briggsae]|uniref:Uncharacterized protein n=1 Tax=Caenorhabditis briggsae TaxID=6238 RepID=A0AAE9A1J3_CAEBR|nr:hypothetical protein L3Y34_007107 [Caenorhabditis briggsae]